MKIITDKILYASQFAAYYSGVYFTRCDTLKEVKAKLTSQCIYIGEGCLLSAIPEISKTLPENACCVIVQFSTEQNYTEYEYRMMRIQKKYVKRFISNMNADYNL